MSSFAEAEPSATQFDGVNARELEQRLGLPRLVLFERVGSTLDVAHAIAAAAPSGTLVVAFLPTGVIGVALYKVVKHLLGDVSVVLWTLLVGGIALILFERFKNHSDADPDFSEITYRKALLVGLFQAIAIVPGVSRSAATIVGGSMIGISKRTIVEFSFMLAVPTMLAASLLELLKGYSALAGHFSILAIGFVVSFVTAIAAIKSFLGYIKKRDFSAFGWYRIVLAVVFYLVFVR